MKRLQAVVSGRVQGVGFRPFIYRLASELNLKGWVRNSAAGVDLEVEGENEQVESFLSRLRAQSPARSEVQQVTVAWTEPAGYQNFEIRESNSAGNKSALVPPDIATCPDCLRDISDPANRRFGYPFTNCTHCGPRFTIIDTIPYDRANTSMRGFVMCPDCQAEFDDPRDRRFHAQPNACPVCGPQLELWDKAGRPLAKRTAALEATAEQLRQGAIVAVKGLGGFHLMAAAHRDDAVRTLRERKHREEKPFALMFPSLEAIQSQCEVSDVEREWLCSPAAPILLLRRHQTVPQSATPISAYVAPGNPYLGALLPYTPLHHLLLQRIGYAVVATSGNAAEEPICIDEQEALERLGRLADLFLVHNRPIVRHADDSILRIVGGREMILRRARGFAPSPIRLKPAGCKAAGQTSVGEPERDASPVLAVGAHLKNAIGLGLGDEVFLSQHIGDLETAEAVDAFERVIKDFEEFYEAKPHLIVADAHPDYVSTRYALSRGTPVLQVQHHYAHALACMAEHGLTDKVLAVCWDGTGYGSDGTVWGGEFLAVDSQSFRRVAHLRTFSLPGADQAAKEPRRSALGLLYELFGEVVFEQHEVPTLQAFSSAELQVLHQMLKRQLNCPRTSSMGRLFDAVASLAGARQCASFEGQPAMELEWAANASDLLDKAGAAFELRVRPGPAHQEPAPPLVLDWEPLVRDLLSSMRDGESVPAIARAFHIALAESIVEMARRTQARDVVLSGGCFQNKLLTELAIERLRAAGLTPYWHRLVPANDGGIALGQVMAARRTPRL